MQTFGLIALIAIYIIIIYRVIKNPSAIKYIFQNKQYGKIAILIIILGWLIWVTSLAVKNIL